MEGEMYTLQEGHLEKKEFFDEAWELLLMETRDTETGYDPGISAPEISRA